MIDKLFSNFFLSAITAFIISMILVPIIIWGKKKYFFYKYFGVSSLVFLYSICILRFLVPVDLGFQRRWYMPRVLNNIYRVLALKTFTIGNVSFKIVYVLGSIWFLVAFILLIGYIKGYLVNLASIKSFTGAGDFVYKTLNVIKKDIGINSTINVLISHNIKVPVSFGIFKKRIILPDIPYCEKELSFILMHELTHFKNNDLLIKFLIHICFCIVWWNPLVYFFSKEIDHALEVRCDAQITSRMNKKEKLDYLQVIIRCLKNFNNGDSWLNYSGSSLLGNRYDLELEERFRLIIFSYPSWRGKLSKYIEILLVIVICIFSYSFVIFPYYDVPSEEIVTEENTVQLTQDNTYITIKDSQYYFVNNDVCTPIDEEVAKSMLDGGFILK